MAEEKKKATPVKNTNAVKKEEKKLGFFQRIGKWFRELKSELKKVVWPTPKQLATNTGVALFVMALAAVVVIWGAYVGIKIAIAHKNEEKINARDMVKNLIIGIIIIFVIAMGAPLLINGLSAWVG